MRDDLTIEVFVALLNAAGRHEEALSILLGRTYHPWEGGEGKPTGQYVQAQIGLRAKTPPPRSRRGSHCVPDPGPQLSAEPRPEGQAPLCAGARTTSSYWLG